MSKPVLYIFAISHYCEKARWALDYLDIDYEIIHLPPGLHVLTAKKLGAPGSSLPILVTDGQVVQGSAKIIDWAESVASGVVNYLTPHVSREAYQEVEKRLDDVLGVHTRRYYYSEALVEHPKTVRPIFAKDLNFLHKLFLSGTWSVVCKRMIDLMDLGLTQGQDSKHIVEVELSWLDGLISGGRHFLIGDQFSRADMTAASLLAPLAAPKEHPTYADLRLPPRLAKDLVSWENRPSINWVRKIYGQYR